MCVCACACACACAWWDGRSIVLLKISYRLNLFNKIFLPKRIMNLTSLLFCQCMSTVLLSPKPQIILVLSGIMCQVLVAF